MGGGFNKKEPIDTRMIHLHPPIADIFRKHQWLDLLVFWKGYDDEFSFNFFMDLNTQSDVSATIIIRGLIITICPEVISRVTTQLLGIKCNREDMDTSSNTKNNFFRSIKRPLEYKNGVRREILPYPWDEVTFNILRYISCEGRLSVVYVYHFSLFHELRYEANLPLN